MAGSLVVIANKELETSLTAITYQCEIHFSRFFIDLHPSSSCPNLEPRRLFRFRGTWISSYSTASLQLLTDHSTSEEILRVYFRGKIREEHYISKLNFSWPQVSCVAGFPCRGSRVVFASYKDCAGQAIWANFPLFPCNDDVIFCSSSQEILKDARDIALLSNDNGSGISSQSEFVPSHRSPYRVREEMDIMTPVHTFATQMPLSSDYEVEQCSHSQEITLDHNCEDILAALPPSFTSLLTNCCTEVKQAAASPAASKEVDLKSQIAMYMEDSSFQDLLSKVAKVIGELGDDLML
ncbi:hypothetical protein L1049_006275 [Liquidambar formosana]|uniref:Poor homologous synapsis 1 PH domain-containing protein n=1 Tax=Liquidambar formosana TaxID=63359 RepID=A0AAP0RF60_LIQFO